VGQGARDVPVGARFEVGEEELGRRPPYVRAPAGSAVPAPFEPVRVPVDHPVALVEGHPHPHGEFLVPERIGGVDGEDAAIGLGREAGPASTAVQHRAGEIVGGEVEHRAVLRPRPGGDEHGTLLPDVSMATFTTPGDMKVALLTFLRRPRAPSVAPAGSACDPS
jgi:hypothetical protein